MTNPFSELGLPAAVVNAVAAMGYASPTPVQQQAIPALLAGRDVLAAAQTGTGKTAAFALPIIARMLAAPKKREPKKVRALVLVPTRELAAQIDENIRAYCAETALNTVLIFGGVNIRPQTEALARGCDFLVATPGRLLDHAGQLNVDLSEVQFLVLDEADRMLDMGFIHDIKRVLKLIPAKRQTLMFSATFSSEIRALADSYLTDPVSVEIAKNRSDANFLGLEVYLDGVVKILKRIKEMELSNLKVMRFNAVDVLNNLVEDESIDGFHIFFPDPWMKKKHHKRRLMQPSFINLLVSKLKKGGYIYFVTDWVEYADEVLSYFSQTESLYNPYRGFAPHIQWRPETKFERKGIEKEHEVRELWVEKR